MLWFFLLAGHRITPSGFEGNTAVEHIPTYQFVCYFSFLTPFVYIQKQQKRHEKGLSRGVTHLKTKTATGFFRLRRDRYGFVKNEDF